MSLPTAWAFSETSVELYVSCMLAQSIEVPDGTAAIVNVLLVLLTFISLLYPGISVDVLFGY